MKITFSINKKYKMYLLTIDETPYELFTISSVMNIIMSHLLAPLSAQEFEMRTLLEEENENKLT